MQEITLQKTAEILSRATGLTYLECMEDLEKSSKKNNTMYNTTPELCKITTKYAKQNIYISDIYSDYRDYQLNGYKGRKYYID